VPGVDPRSGRDTFVAARLWIDNPRWRHVPFYLRTGKRMATSKQRVSLIRHRSPRRSVLAVVTPAQSSLWIQAGTGGIRGVTSLCCRHARATVAV
jgi:glucose-6-phosphate 1-dehydrogenase